MLRGLALGLPLYMVAAHLWSFVLIAPRFAPNADFRAFYAGAHLVWDGQATRLYDFDEQNRIEKSEVSDGRFLPFVNPAYCGLLLAPLAAFPYRAAYLIQFCFNLGLLITCVWLLWERLYSLRSIYPWLPFALALGFHPAAVALIMGQGSIIMAFCLLSAFLMLESDKPLEAGAMMALALFKYQYLIPIALLFLVWQRWRVLAGFAATATVLTVVSIYVAGIDQSLVFGTRSASMVEAIWPMTANIAGMCFSLFGVALWSKILFAALSVATFAWTAWAGQGKNLSTQLLIAIPCALLLSYHSYMHDATILLLPILIVLEKDLRAGRLNYFAAAMLTLPMLESFAPNLVYLLALPITGMIVTLRNLNSPLTQHSESGFVEQITAPGNEGIEHPDPLPVLQPALRRSLLQ